MTDGRSTLVVRFSFRLSSFFLSPSYYYSTFNARRDDSRRHLVDDADDGYRKAH
jgi:hypothetical protein